MKILNSFSTAIIIGTSFFISTPVGADLGSADMDTEKTISFTSSRTHKAWCNEVKNNCKVDFKDGIMSVDGSAGIESKQIISITERIVPQDLKKCGFICVYGPNPVDYEYSVQYNSSNGDIKKARILFSGDSDGWKFFRKDLEDWTGKALRSVGPSIKIDE